ncbi:hypothetical protein [Flavobacterium aquicola]|uniref:Uncharacterized protein n=1 Tax=Flavobacterium aquicola TaxID=1682742 RepID=A0A3E0ESD7_9FLAO|nr:hypothetical protein [Flavobacterium aquicola]REH01138.1 hypothetical protein C8P67_102397 [Flavobacterium aquicola]
MKKTVFIFNIIFSTLIFAQNTESLTQHEKEYNDLINYIPKNIKSDSIIEPENRFLKVELNTICSLIIFSGIRSELEINETDNKWLDNRIEQIATALFLDGKRILISTVGGYSGCPDKKIDTLYLNNIKITDLKFCHGCTDRYLDEKFIEIFNKKMYSLMKIEPPNRKTSSFYGEYKGRNKDKFEMKLVLKDDRTFKFWLNKGHGSDFTEGLWKNEDDLLTLNSKILSKNDEISTTISSAKWINFNNLKFNLKKNKLIELNDQKRKLKKAVE